MMFLSAAFVSIPLWLIALVLRDINKILIKIYEQNRKGNLRH